MPAEHLRIRVSQSGQTRVDLTFKAALAASLPDLIPPSLAPMLQARNLDVAKIAAEAVERQFAPGELFQLADGGKEVRVWLE